MLDWLVSGLIRIGFISGKTLDKAIAQMTKLDRYLEEIETLENAKIEAATQTISKAEEDKATAEETAAKAARIRARAKEFVS